LTKTRGKIANRAARIFIADFYSGNIARVHSSVRFHLFKISSCYRYFFEFLLSHRTFPRTKNARPCDFVRGLFAVSLIYSRFVRAITRFSAQIQRKPY